MGRAVICYTLRPNKNIIQQNRFPSRLSLVLGIAVCPKDLSEGGFRTWNYPTLTLKTLRWCKSLAQTVGKRSSLGRLRYTTLERPNRGNNLSWCITRFDQALQCCRLEMSHATVSARSRDVSPVRSIFLSPPRHLCKKRTGQGTGHSTNPRRSRPTYAPDNYPKHPGRVLSGIPSVPPLAPI